MTNDPIAGARAGIGFLPAANGPAPSPAPYPADIAEHLSREMPQAAAAMLRTLDPADAVRVLEQPEYHGAARTLAALSFAESATLIAAMAEDRAADLLADLAAGEAEAVLALLPPPVRQSLRRLLAWPTDSAGGLMTTEFVAVAEGITVAQALDHIRTVERSRETIYALYLLDPAGRLTGALSLRRLISAEPDAVVRSLAPSDPVTTAPDADREDVARQIARHDLLAVPVVDAHRRLLGIVTVDDVLDVIVAEATEDSERFGGVAALGRPYLDTGFGAMIRKRAGWLCALFLSEMLTASAMQHFESELERAIVLTLFIPLIMSSGGNSGSQATSLIIRALALHQVRLRDWWRVAFREMPTGLVLGAILGLLGMARIAAWQAFGFYDYGPHWPLIAATVGAGLIGIVTFGSLAGSMLPFALQRLGFDPASASAPFVATLVDVTGLVIYFSIALVILHGTLL